ncbi:MAG TPA: hypothetical protein VGF96_07850 [Terracidiphilus sp.]
MASIVMLFGVGLTIGWRSAAGGARATGDPDRWAEPDPWTDGLDEPPNVIY